MRRTGLAFVLALLAVMVAGPALARHTIVVGIGSEPPHLDPTAGTAPAIGEVTYANLFEGLTRIDRDGRIRPALAERWDVSQDGTVYTFVLRQGAIFQDGTGFGPEDVKFSLERAMAKDGPNPRPDLFEPIASVEIAGPAIVRVRLKRPTPGFLFDLALPAAVIVSPESAAGDKTKPIGTGPFAFDRWVKGDSISLKRNEAYWGKPPALERLVFKVISNPNAAYAALVDGEVDAFPTYPAPGDVSRFEADPRFTVVIGNTEGKAAVIDGVNSVPDGPARPGQKIGIWNARLTGFWENASIPINDLTGVKWRD